MDGAEVKSRKTAPYPIRRVLLSAVLGGGLTGAGVSLLLVGSWESFPLLLVGLALAVGAVAYEVIDDGASVSALHLAAVAVVNGTVGARLADVVREDTRGGLSLVLVYLLGATIGWWLYRNTPR